jgi:hypothetical protein
MDAHALATVFLNAYDWTPDLQILCWICYRTQSEKWVLCSFMGFMKTIVDLTYGVVMFGDGIWIVTF